MKKVRIAVSGYSGCGNTTVTTILEQKHGFKHLNFTLRDLGKEKGKTLEEMHELVKKGPEADYELDRRQTSAFAKEKKAVVGSRLAIWLDSPKIRDTLGLRQNEIPKIDLKVWLDASLEVRATRTQQAKPDESKAFTAKRDKENAERYQKLYGIDVSRHDFADLTINVEKFDAESVAAIIAAAAAQLKK